MQTVLYVEDDFNDRELMINAVNRAKPQFELRLQNDFGETLDYLRNQGLYEDRGYYQPPDLVLLGYSLGDFKGTDLLDWIRKKSKFQTLPVVMFSSNTDEQIVAKCYALSANCFIAKPFQTTERLRLVNCLVNCLNVCLQTMPPRMEKLAELAIRPALPRRSLRREVREYRSEAVASLSL